LSTSGSDINLDSNYLQFFYLSSHVSSPLTSPLTSHVSSHVSPLLSPLLLTSPSHLSFSPLLLTSPSHLSFSPLLLTSPSHLSLMFHPAQRNLRANVGRASARIYFLRLVQLAFCFCVPSVPDHFHGDGSISLLHRTHQMREHGVAPTRQLVYYISKSSFTRRDILIKNENCHTDGFARLSLSIFLSTFNNSLSSFSPPLTTPELKTYLRSTTLYTALPPPYHCATTVLSPLCFTSASTLLRLCFDSASTLLRLCFDSAATPLQLHLYFHSKLLSDALGYSPVLRF
jgi:hypothetical protein